MRKRVGFQPIPDDVNVADYLRETERKHSAELEEILEELRRTMSDTTSIGQPAIFAYGKLLNFLAAGVLSEPELHKLLAAALWELK